MGYHERASAHSPWQSQTIFGEILRPQKSVENESEANAHYVAAFHRVGRNFSLNENAAHLPDPKPRPQ